MRIPASRHGRGRSSRPGPFQVVSAGFGHHARSRAQSPSAVRTGSPFTRRARPKPPGRWVSRCESAPGVEQFVLAELSLEVAQGYGSPLFGAPRSISWLLRVAKELCAGPVRSAAVVRTKRRFSSLMPLDAGGRAIDGVVRAAAVLEPSIRAGGEQAVPQRVPIRSLFLPGGTPRPWCAPWPCLVARGRGCQQLGDRELE
jgi:hypothetical protein